MSIKSYYKTLEIPQNASHQTIKEQYRVLVKKWHPDKFPDPLEKLKVEEKIREINEAYQALMSHIHTPTQKTVKPWMPPHMNTCHATPKAKPHQFTYKRFVGQYHYDFYASYGDQVNVSLDQKAHIYLLNNTNYQRYQKGLSFHGMGGYIAKAPLIMRVPHASTWHLVIDLEDRTNVAQTSINIVPF